MWLFLWFLLIYIFCLSIFSIMSIRPLCVYVYANRRMFWTRLYMRVEFYDAHSFPSSHQCAYWADRSCHSEKNPELSAQQLVDLLHSQTVLVISISCRRTCYLPINKVSDTIKTCIFKHSLPGRITVINGGYSMYRANATAIPERSIPH